ncbi:collagen alpha-1(XII) chain-like [Festucalex cinctus]
MDRLVWCFFLLVSIITLINAQDTTDAPGGGSPGDANVTCDTGEADIVFLVDGSRSIGINNFILVLNFLENLALGFMVDDGRIRVGFVQFSFFTRMEWDLNTHMTEAALVDAIRNVRYLGGGTPTGAALTFVLQNSFRPEVGSRAGVAKVVILVTDGMSTDNVTLPAQALRDAGIEVFAVGVANADEDELRTIASPPLDTHVFNVADFGVISDILGNLTSNICDAVDDTPGTGDDPIREGRVYAHIKARVMHALGANVTEILQQFLLNVTRNICTDCQVDVTTTVTPDQIPPV